jgi:capsular exopolysaccharide synthesis family protein
MTRFNQPVDAETPSQIFPVSAPADPGRRSVMQIVWSRRLIVLITMLVLTAGSFAYVQLATPIYMSGARMQVQQEVPKALAPDEVTGQTDSRTRLYTECEIIRSTQVLNDALQSPGIADLATFKSEPKKSLEYLIKHVTATVGKQDDLVTVTFESEFSEDVPRIVAAIVNAYMSFQSHNRQDTARAVLTILDREKSVRDGILNGSLQAMLNFRKEHSEIGFGGDKGNIIVQRLERLSNALTEAELTLVEAKADHDALAAIQGGLSEVSPTTAPSGAATTGPATTRPAATSAPAAHVRATSGPATTGPAGDASRKEGDKAAQIRRFFEAKRAGGKFYIGGQDESSRLQGELNDLQLKLEALKRDYPASNPAVQTVESSIKTISQQIIERENQAASMEVAMVEQDYQSAQDRMVYVASAYGKQLKEAQRLNQTMTEYAPLESAYDQSKKLVEAIDNQLRQLNMTQDVGAINIRLIEPCSKPEKPYKPDKLRVVGICCGLGLLLGLGLAMLWDWRDPRLIGAEQMSAAVGVPVMAMLPELKTKRGQVAADFGRSVLEFPRSPVAEGYRGLRTSLILGMADAKAKTLLVTSPGSQEGKSTLISNLAVAMAQAGQRTLVLDADFRHPKQHEIFKVSNESGLSTLLQNGQDFEKAVLPSGQAGLDILPAGPTPSQPSELLGGRAFLEMIRKLGERYDLVLIDSPPVTAVADSLILSARSDVTLLVLRAEHSHRNLAEETRKSLAGVGANVCGVVVNGVSAKKLRRNYYTDYSAAGVVPANAAADPFAIGTGGDGEEKA